MQERGADEASGQVTHRASSRIPDTSLPGDRTDAHVRTARAWRPAARAAERTAARDLMRADVSVHVPRRDSSRIPDTSLPGDRTDAHVRTARAWRPAARAAE